VIFEHVEATEMPVGSRAARSALFASLTLAIVSSSRGDSTEQPARATIRGTGNNVTIVYRGDAKTQPRKRTPDQDDVGPLTEAVRLKMRGVDDAAVVSYLRVHRTDLPPIVEAEAVRQLRRAGAGESLISDLATLAALDIGATGGIGGVTVISETENVAAYGIPYEGTFGGGYPLGIGYGLQTGLRFARHSFFRPPLLAFHRGHMAFPRSLGMHAPFPNHPVRR
jgi:hypothetical protein